MTVEQMILAAASAFYGLLLTALGWAWRRSVSEQDRLRADVDLLSERVTRQEERTARLSDIETSLARKIDELLQETRQISERLARLEAARGG